MYKKPDFFESEEHIEISTQQQIEMQGTKQLGTEEATIEEKLYYPEEAPTPSSKPKKIRKQLKLEEAKK